MKRRRRRSRFEIEESIKPGLSESILDRAPRSLTAGGRRFV
jgi:hypothetical protein